MACASPSGYSIPPMVIFDRKHLQMEMTMGVIPGTFYGLSNSGWMNAKLFHVPVHACYSDLHTWFQQSWSDKLYSNWCHMHNIITAAWKWLPKIIPYTNSLCAFLHAKKGWTCPSHTSFHWATFPVFSRAEVEYFQARLKESTDFRYALWLKTFHPQVNTHATARGGALEATLATPPAHSKLPQYHCSARVLTS